MDISLRQMPEGNCRRGDKMNEIRKRPDKKIRKLESKFPEKEQTKKKEGKLPDKVLLKFSFPDSMKGTIPEGIPEKASGKKAFKEMQRSTENPESFGRLRKDRVDTGTQTVVSGEIVVQKFVEELKQAGFMPINIHRFLKQATTVVVVMFAQNPQPGDEVMTVKEETVNNLLKIKWKMAYLFKNPPDSKNLVFDQNKKTYVPVQGGGRTVWTANLTQPSEVGKKSSEFLELSFQKWVNSHN